MWCDYAAMTNLIIYPSVNWYVFAIGVDFSEVASTFAVEEP